MILKDKLIWTAAVGVCAAMFWGAWRLIFSRNDPAGLDQSQSEALGAPTRPQLDRKEDGFISRFRALASTETPAINHREEYRALWTDWGKAAPDEAVKFLRTEVPERWLKQFYKDLFHAIAWKFGPEYSKWYDGLSELNQKFAVEGIVSGLGQYSAPAIAGWIGNSENAQWQNAEAAGWIAKALMQNGGIAKVHKVLSLATAPQAPFESEIFGKAVGIMAKPDAKAALGQLKSCPDPSLVNAASLAMAFPPLITARGGTEIMTFAQTIAGQNVARPVAIAAWAEVNPDDAGQWLNQHTNEPDRNELIGIFSKAICKMDPEGAAKWAATISDETLRNTVLKALQPVKPVKP